MANEVETEELKEDRLGMESQVQERMEEVKIKKR